MTTIRRAEARDREAILALWEAADMAQTTPSEWQALTSGTKSTILVAEDAGDIVGAAVATYNGWRAYLYHLAVDPARRHQGIGHELVAAAERYLVDAGAKYAYVMVGERNTEGLALVGASGFLPDGEITFVKRLFILVPA